jgi:hypothetical protein
MQAFRAVASNSLSGTTTGNKTLTINKPAGTVDGDVMLAIVANVSGVTAAITAPAGWTSLGAFTVTETKTEAFRKVAASEGASYAFTVGGGDAHIAAGIIASFSGVTLTPSPIAADAEQSNTTASTSADAPSVTAPTANEILVCMYSTSGIEGTGFVTSTPPSGMTERADVGRVQLTSDGYFEYNLQVSLCDVLLSSSGATGTKTATLSAARTSTGFSVALYSRPTGGYNMVL